jgi:carboxymethylenebutenolidase
MCDDDTEAENATYLAQLKLNRRQWGIGAGATVATMLSGCGPSSDKGPASTPEPQPKTAAPDEAMATVLETTSRQVSIDTPDGVAEAFFVAPSSGRHPGVLIWPDVAGLREAFESMATRLAAQGYAVLAVNHYYRSSKLPVLTTFSEWRTEEGKAKIRPMAEALTPERIASDGAAFVAWLDGQQEVDAGRKLGTTGYCMGGPFTFRTAAAAPERVGAIGSFHGGGLVTEEEDSPHTLLPRMKAAALVCVARNDDERSPETRPALQEAAQAAGVTAEIEVYPAQHGWCVIDSPVYDEEQAERAWARMLATFEAHL